MGVCVKFGGAWVLYLGTTQAIGPESRPSSTETKEFFLIPGVMSLMFLIQCKVSF